MKLNLTSFERAISRLNQSLAYCESDLAKQDKGLKQQLKMACIQAFEYTYELSHKMLKRYLEMSEATSETIDLMAFPELIRTGSERGLLRSDWSCWKRYRDIRNITAHTYDEEKAEIAFSVIPDFLAEADYLLQKLRERTAMYKGINVTPDQAKIITSILKLLPANSHVWVFGSRLKSTIKPFSDLDLAIDCAQNPLSLSLMADLRQAFEESSLPYKVDIVDVNATSPEFLTLINKDKIPFDLDMASSDDP